MRSCSWRSRRTLLESFFQTLHGVEGLKVKVIAKALASSDDTNADVCLISRTCPCALNSVTWVRGHSLCDALPGQRLCLITPQAGRLGGQHRLRGVVHSPAPGWGVARSWWLEPWSLCPGHISGGQESGCSRKAFSLPQLVTEGWSSA